MGIKSSSVSIDFMTFHYKMRGRYRRPEILGEKIPVKVAIGRIGFSAVTGREEPAGLGSRSSYFEIYRSLSVTQKVLEVVGGQFGLGTKQCLACVR